MERIDYVDCPVEISEELERVYFEKTMTETILDRFLDRNQYNEDVFETPVYKTMAKKLAKLNYEYEILQNQVTQNIIPKKYHGHQVYWIMDFANNRLEIHIQCDCEF